MNIGLELTLTLGTVVTVVLAIVGWVRTRNSAVDKRLDRHESRISAFEQALAQMPGKEDVHTLTVSLARIEGDLKTMGAVLQGQREIMTRLENVVIRQDDYLMRNRN